ncbi:MAG TPA: hypothetical protein VK517_07095 [Cyclobacteriaceae bacterium]|nr:hypothetical protein [Cyclobacteriaceae bacterium]
MCLCVLKLHTGIIYERPMIDIATARKLALSFEGAIELPHFDKTSFRINKKIFATMDIKNKRVCLLLSLIDQSVFCEVDKSIIYPVPNKWGKKGATFVELQMVRKDIFRDALTTAYCRVAPKKLANLYLPDGEDS